MPVNLPTPPIDRTVINGAVFATRWLRPSTAVITVHGELDAANAPALTEFATRHAIHADRMVLDLTGVEFFGTAGFFTLQELDARCVESDVDWVLVPSRAVTRLLQTCDPTRTLPSRDTVAAALAAPSNSRLLQLVTQPR